MRDQTACETGDYDVIRFGGLSDCETDDTGCRVDAEPSQQVSEISKGHGHYRAEDFS